MCNYGYARFLCPHFPEGAPGDAVRFSILKDADKCTELVYIVEKDHAPVDHGQLTYWVAEGRLEGAPASDVLARQARAFLDSHSDSRCEPAPVTAGAAATPED